MGRRATFLPSSRAAPCALPCFTAMPILGECRFQLDETADAARCPEIVMIAHSLISRLHSAPIFDQLPALRFLHRGREEKCIAFSPLLRGLPR